MKSAETYVYYGVALYVMFSGAVPKDLNLWFVLNFTSMQSNKLSALVCVWIFSSFIKYASVLKWAVWTIFCIQIRISLRV